MLVHSLVALEKVYELVLVLVLGEPGHDDFVKGRKFELLASHVLIQEGFSLLRRQVRVRGAVIRNHQDVTQEVVDLLLLGQRRRLGRGRVRGLALR